MVRWGVYNSQRSGHSIPPCRALGSLLSRPRGVPLPASGWVGLMSCAGTLIGAGVGFGTGTGWWSTDSAYYGCAAVNVAIAATGCISLSGTPTLSALATSFDAMYDAKSLAMLSIAPSLYLAYKDDM